MTADMGGPGGRAGFGWSPKDGHWRSPLKGENREVLSGGDLLDWTSPQDPYEADPPSADAAPRRRWWARWQAWWRRRRAPAVAGRDETPGT